METKWTLIEWERGCFYVFIGQFNSALWASCSFPETASLSSGISMVSHIHVKNLNTPGIIPLLFMLQMLTSQCFSFLTLYLLLWCICVVCVCVGGAHVMGRGSRTTLWSRCSTSAFVVVARIELRSSGLRNRTLPTEPFYSPMFSTFCVFTFLETQNIKMMLS